MADGFVRGPSPGSNAGAINFTTTRDSSPVTMTSIDDVPVEVVARIVEMCGDPSSASETCRLMRLATSMATSFETVEMRRPWLGKGSDVIEKTKNLKIDASSEDDSNSLVEWMRTRPNRGFRGVESVTAVLHSTSFRPITTMHAFARAFPSVKRLSLSASEGFEIPHELVFPAKGLENLESFEAVLPRSSECWLEVFAGYPRPPKLRCVCVRVKDS
jgi:hypothetical protein